MDIQFNHQNLPYMEKKTYAVGLPAAVDFTELLENPNREITLPVGIAYCSPKDNYCKKTGREVALNRMAPVTYTLRTMEFVDGDIYFHLHCGDLSFLNVKMSAKSSRLHLIHAI